MAASTRRGARAIGVDISLELLTKAARHGDVVRAEVPPLGFLADDSVDGVVMVLVLEHLRDEEQVFGEAARVTRGGGAMALVVNHPIWTAPGSTPIREPDGEVLWRPGEYLSAGWSDEPAGGQIVRFFHRPLARLVNSAADAGWSLQRMTEEGVSSAQIVRTPELAGQEHFPRLLGARWTLQ